MDSASAAVEGYVEGVDEFLNVLGWAKYGDGSTPVKLEVAINGTIVSEGIPDLYRPDLIAKDVSAQRVGFRLPIPRNKLRRLRSIIHVLHDGKPLPGSPLVLHFSRKMSIAIDGIEDQRLLINVAGWPGAAILAAVKIDGIEVDTVQVRSSGAYMVSGELQKIAWPIPDQYADGRAHTYVVEIDHDNEVARSDATTLVYPEYAVSVERAGFSTMVGMAVRRDRKSPVVIEAWSGERLIGRAVADEFRDEQSPERCGFSFAFNAPLPGNHAEILLKDAETGIGLQQVSITNSYETLGEIASQFSAAQDTLFSPVATAMATLITGNSGGIDILSRPMLSHDGGKGTGEVAVIIPVYGGAMELAECLESVFAAKNDTKMLLILVNDNTPDPTIAAYLRSIEIRKLDNVRIIHRSNNHGFSAAVNVGMAIAGQRDVILLNADTVVQDRWIDKIVAAAAQDPRIGTVTPFSNNGEIATIPDICKSVPVASPSLARQVDETAGRLNAGKIVDIPVAIGFCMFIARSCLNDVGLFDAEKWGRGYGEEVDFCLKAYARGWRHVLAADTFMIHRGSVSFGDEKLQRVIEAARKINETFPFYDQVIQRFIAADPVGAMRRPVNLEVLGSTLPERRVLHITHSLGGGTERYISDLGSLYEDDDYTNLVLRFAPHNGCMLELHPDQDAFGRFYQKVHRERYRSHELESLKIDLLALKIERIHLHSPIAVPASFLEWLSENFEFNVTVHDYAWACPSVTFTMPNGHYYGDEPDDIAGIASAFAKPFNGLDEYAALAESDIAAYRARFNGLFQKARMVFCGSNDVASRLRQMGFDTDFVVGPLPIASDSPLLDLRHSPAKIFPGEPIRVALFGGIGDIKGFRALLSCARYVEENALPIQFIIFGFTKDNSAFAGSPRVQILGPYDEKDIGSLIAQHRPHVSWFPNQGPETFSLTLSIALRGGIWPVVTDIGAPAERIRASGYGSIYPKEDGPDRICSLLMQAAHDQRRFSSAVDERPEDLDTYLGQSDRQ